jgi:hypothetical protein
MSLLVQVLGDWQTGASTNTEIIEIAAFTTDGLVVGYGSANVSREESLIGLAVWGDDPTTEKIDGCRDSERLNVRGWRNGAEFQADFDWVEGEAVYATDGFTYAKMSTAESLPVEFALEKPYPNPFNSTVVISYALPSASAVEFVVTDVAGREQFRWGKEIVAAGRHRFEWNGGMVSTGIYFVTMRAGEFKRTEKLLLVK